MKGIIKEASQVVTDYEEKRRIRMINSAVDYGMRAVDTRIPIEKLKEDLEETAHLMQMGEEEFIEFVRIVQTSICDYSEMKNGLNYQVIFNDDTGNE